MREECKSVGDTFDWLGDSIRAADADPFMVLLVSVVCGRIPFYRRTFVAPGETFLVFQLKAFSDNPILWKRNFLPTRSVLPAPLLFLSRLNPLNPLNFLSPPAPIKNGQHVSAR